MDEAQVKELQDKLAAMEAKVSETTTAFGAIQTQADTYKTRLVDHYRSNALTGLIDEELAKLAPPIELDEQGNITSESASALGEWRKTKKHFFAAAVEAPSTGTTKPTDKTTTTIPKAPAVSGAQTTAVTWDYWEDMEKNRPEEFARKQREYVEWGKKQPRYRG